jgi:hypothetical protein
MNLGSKGTLSGRKVTLGSDESGKDGDIPHVSIHKILLTQVWLGLAFVWDWVGLFQQVKWLLLYK